MLNRASHRSGKPVFPWGVAIVLAFVLALPSAGAHADSFAGEPELATIVRCDPTTGTGVVGVSNAVVDMYIEDVVNLYGVDLRIAFFDTTIAQVVDQSTTAGVQIQPLNTFLIPQNVVRNTASNTVGTIRYAVHQINPTEPASGSGPVARITFEGLQAGSFTMTWGTIELSDRFSNLIPHTAQPCTITFTNPLAVTLASFEATAQADHVLLAWETVSEVSNSGFNLYRSETAGGPRALLNAALIPSQNPGGTQGAAYAWQDFTVQPDQVYYYWLEDVSLAGAANLHGPVSVEYLGPTAVTLGGMAATPAAAAGLSWLWIVAGAGAALGVGRLRRRG